MSGAELRQGLGGYAPRGRPLPPGALTLHDIGELIRRAGLAAGFVVETEFKCRVRGPGNNRRKIDGVWFSPRDRLRPIVAVEIERRDVNRDRLEDADRQKFTDCNAPVSVLALFHVDRDLTRKGRATGGEGVVARATRLVALQNVQVVLDEHLMRPGGIEAIQKAARRALKARVRAHR